MSDDLKDPNEEGKLPDKEDTNEQEKDYQKVPDYQGKGHNIEPIERRADLMNDEIYIQQRLVGQRDWCNNKANYNQKRYKFLKRWEFILSASIPVIISFSTMGAVDNTSIITHTVISETGIATEVSLLSLATIFQIFAAGAGVVLVIMNKVLDLEEYHKNWKEYRLTNEQLEQERLLYLTRSEPYDEGNAFPLLVEKVESILAHQVQRWKQVPKNQSNDLYQKALESLDKQQVSTK